MNVASCDPFGKTEGEFQSGLRAKAQFQHICVPSVPWHHTLKCVLITIPGVHSAKLGAPSLFRSSAQESIVYLANRADSPDFCVDRRRPLVPGPVAQSAWIAR